MIRAGLTGAFLLTLSWSAIAEAVPAGLSSQTENPTGDGNVVATEGHVRFAAQTRVWYGWQTLATDASALAPLLAIGPTPSS